MTQVRGYGTFSRATAFIESHTCCSFKTNLRLFFSVLLRTGNASSVWADSYSWIFASQAIRDGQLTKLQSVNKLRLFTAECAASPQVILLYSWAAGKSSWLPVSTPVERITLIQGDTWWVIALSTRPLVLLTGLVWSFIYTPFCSGFQDNFPSSLQSTNYKARPLSLGGMLNSEKDHWFGRSLQKTKNYTGSATLVSASAR